jgi:hypothetical protein
MISVTLPLGDLAYCAGAHNHRGIVLPSSFSSSSVRRGCGLRRRFRMVVIRPVPDVGRLLFINWRAVGQAGKQARRHLGISPLRMRCEASV